MQSSTRSTADFASMNRTMRTATENPYADGVDAELYGR